MRARSVLSYRFFCFGSLTYPIFYLLPYFLILVKYFFTKWCSLWHFLHKYLNSFICSFPKCRYVRWCTSPFVPIFSPHHSQYPPLRSITNALRLNQRLLFRYFSYFSLPFIPIPYQKFIILARLYLLIAFLLNK